MARTAKIVTTAELDPARASVAAERLAAYQNVELLTGDWRELLPPYGPFELFFLDAGGFKHAPYESGDLVYGLLTPGGLLVMDDLTPGWSAFDPPCLGARPLRATSGGDPDDALDLCPARHSGRLAGEVRRHRDEIFVAETSYRMEAPVRAR